MIKQIKILVFPVPDQPCLSTPNPKIFPEISDFGCFGPFWYVVVPHDNHANSFGL